MRWSLPLFGLCTALFVAAQTQPTAESDYAPDEAVLRGMNLPTKGPALLQTLRDRTPKVDTGEKFKTLAARLDAATFQERMKATTDLLKMGSIIRPLLVALIAEGRLELETKRRVEQILEHFPPEKDIAAVTATARLLVRDRPADRLAVLLDFVPHVSEESVRQEVQRAVDVSALEDKKPAPLVLQALKDTNVQRRAAAAEALVRALGPAAAREHIEPLMKDAHSLVQYQLGMALVEKQDKAGLPLLIQTIAEGPPERVEYVIDLLYRASGEAGPAEYYQGRKNAQAVSAAWQKWYVKHQANLDLSKMLERTDLGYTVLAVTQARVNTKSKIFEIGARPQNAVRWQFEGPRAAYDLQILGPNRLLVAEYSEARVTERDFKGTVLKQFPVSLPIGCQRMPNGNTFIVSRQKLQIIDTDGKEVFGWTPPQPNPFIMSAQWQRNGDMAVMVGGGVCMLLDRQGKELKRFNTGANAFLIGTNIEVLPNGRVLVPLYTQQQVAEFEWTGNKVWSAAATRPLSVSRLPNGNTLVTTSLAPYRITELDRNGKEVWSYQTDGRPTRARRR